jgi:hypothetical protein
LVPALPEVAVEAELAVLSAQPLVRALPEVVVVPAHLELLPVLAQPAVLVPLLEVVVELAGEEVSVEALHRSFSAAMVGNLPSTGTPRYSPVPRSGRRAKRRP